MSATRDMVSQMLTYAFHMIPLAVLWLSVVLEWLPVLRLIQNYPYFHHVIYFIPAYLIIGLGVYALFSVIYGVVTFNDCNEAREELVHEIKEARSDLKKRKIID